MEDSLQLGGNIELVGFKQLDSASMIVLKKLVGNYARKFSDSQGFQQLKLSMKPVHSASQPHCFEVNCRVAAHGKSYASELTDYNLFFAVDKVLKRVESEMQ